MSSSNSTEELGKSSEEVIGRVDFTTLPLENQINVLWYCDESALINIAQTNKAYYHLILGDDDDESDEVNAYRNTIWKVRVLGLLNGLIDEYNKTIIDQTLDVSLLHNLNENDLTQYVKNNLKFKEDNRIIYSQLLHSLKRINFDSVSSAEIEAKGRSVQNKTVMTWYSFLNGRYPIGVKPEYFFSNICLFLGYEIVIDKYSNSNGNDWNIVFGIGTKYDDFGSSLSIAEFTPENNGVGYIVHNKHFKIKGQAETALANDSGEVKLGDRFAIKLDAESGIIHFFKNGNHIATVEGGGELVNSKVMYYPIISMCVDMGVTLYPLLQVSYPLNETINTIHFRN